MPVRRRRRRQRRRRPAAGLACRWPPRHKSADAASAWLEQVAPRLPDDSPDERLALAEAWREVGSQFSSVPALQKARDLLAPMIHRPDADVSAWALAAEVAQELGDYDTAEQGWRRLLQDATATRPDRPPPRSATTWPTC